VTGPSNFETSLDDLWVQTERVGAGESDSIDLPAQHVEQLFEVVTRAVGTCFGPQERDDPVAGNASLACAGKKGKQGESSSLNRDGRTRPVRQDKPAERVESQQ
jgi:hypothetical protein